MAGGSTSSTSSLVSRTMEAFRSPIAKKALMAVTGLVLFGFLVGHLLGNLQVFEGPKKLDDYARFLKENAALLWGTRIVLLVALGFHVKAAVLLELEKKAARAIPYQSPRSWREATLASRTMIYSGLLILVFVVYHLLHFTFGWSGVNATFEDGHVYHNVVSAFKGPATVLAYAAAMALLGLHLAHGLGSVVQTTGLGGFDGRRKHVSTAIAVVLAGGFALIPLAIFLGLITERAP
jgi:succinate dehydrogenase / fumarate reductase cytochrome b subunit